LPRLGRSEEPLALSLSKGELWFDKLTTSGARGFLTAKGSLNSF